MNTKRDSDRLERIILGQEQVLNTVHQWLREEETEEAIVHAAILSSKRDELVPVGGLDRSRIFHRDAIRELCVRYRLRFLHAGLFKGAIPRQAVQAVRDLERRAGRPIHGFRIMAPASRFRLCDSEADPLLFVQVAEDRYYLVHRWGHDLAVSRAIAYWPMRSPMHLASTLFVMALALTLIVPTGWLTGSEGAPWMNGTRILFFFWISVVLASMTAFGWFAFFGKFSTEAWNSRHFN